jgi:nucleoside triphosphate pyrophosphatase
VFSPTTLLKEKLILASKSARRAEILRAVDWPFEAIAANIDESRGTSEDAVTYVMRLAREKAETVAAKISAGLVLGADTVVVVDDEILGQPRDDQDAQRMLRLLSGKWHQVVTGVALLRAGNHSESGVPIRAAPLCKSLNDHETTRVRFCEMSAKEIDWYVSTGEPRDKAGAYAIQGGAALFIEEIEGDYFNIVGLPVRLVYELLRKL